MTVTVSEGANVVCTTECTSGGSYSCSGVVYGPGSYDLVAHQSSGGKTSQPSDTSTITVSIPTNHCWVGNALFEDNDLDPTSEGCRVCDSTKTDTAWSPVADGTECASDGYLWTEDVCDNGICVHNATGNCDIGGTLVPNGTLNFPNDCEWCDSSTNPSGWSARPLEAQCADDGLGWTFDVCDGARVCTHVHAGKCWTGEELVDAGSQHPTNDCLECRPSASASGWSPKAKGSACEDDGLSCTADVCDGAGQCDHVVSEGCLIGGECVADRDSEPGKDCHECNARYSKDAYSPKPDGENCDADGEDGVCDGGGTCWPRPAGQCLIDGVAYANGQVNPENECQRCDSFLDPEGWVSRARGAACEDDGLPCTSSVCDGAGHCGTMVVAGCLINDDCVTAGAKDPSNDCMECNPAQMLTSYVPRVVGSVCGDGGDFGTQDLCDGTGTCQHGEDRGHCTIDGDVWDAGTVDPENGCRWCSPSDDSEGWTIRPNGTDCSSDQLSCTNDVCDAGKCTHVLFGACLIEGHCVGIGGMPLDDDCAECNPGVSTEEYSPRAPGSVCSSELGDPTMMNTCDGVGDCGHKVRGTCIIGGKSRPEGVSNPTNECEWCEPEKDPEGWSPKAAGNHCADDEMNCTADVCDSAGLCTHEVMSGSCAINSECIAAGAKKPSDPCLVCDPDKDKTDYTPSSAKGCIPCQSNADCEPDEVCEFGVCVPEPLPDCLDDDACPEGEICDSGVCVPPPALDCVSDAGCPEGERCISGICMPVPPTDCVVDVDCPAGEKCEGGICVPEPKNVCIDDNGCPDGQMCEGGVCRDEPECDGERACALGFDCVDGKCEETKPTNACNEDVECEDGACVGGKCVKVSLEGGGCSCTGVGASGTTSGVGPFAVLGALIGWVRRRRACGPSVAM